MCFLLKLVEFPVLKKVALNNLKLALLGPLLGPGTRQEEDAYVYIYICIA